MYKNVQWLFLGRLLWLYFFVGLASPRLTIEAPPPTHNQRLYVLILLIT